MDNIEPVVAYPATALRTDTKYLVAIPALEPKGRDIDPSILSAHKEQRIAEIKDIFTRLGIEVEILYGQTKIYEIIQTQKIKDQSTGEVF